MTNHTTCDFCTFLKKTKDLYAYYAKPDYTEEYTAALVVNSYYKNISTGTCTYCNYKLNYCPVCGKKIN